MTLGAQCVLVIVTAVHNCISIELSRPSRSRREKAALSPRRPRRHSSFRVSKAVIVISRFDQTSTTTLKCLGSQTRLGTFHEIRPLGIYLSYQQVYAPCYPLVFSETTLLAVDHLNVPRRHTTTPRTSTHNADSLCIPQSTAVGAGLAYKQKDKH